MEDPIRPIPFIERIRRMLNDLFEKFKKTQFAGPTAIGITALVYYLMMTFIPGSCWIGLVPSLLLFGLLWQFDIRKVRKMLLYGLICTVVILVVSTSFLVYSFQTTEMGEAHSEGDNPVLVNGTVTPDTGGKSTIFTYSLTVRSTEPGLNISEVRVNIFSFSNSRNETMVQIGENESLNETYYSYTTQVSDPVNAFYFVALVNDTWVWATDYEGDSEVAIMRHIYSDTWAVAFYLVVKVTAFQAFLQFLPIFAILSGMVWWMRRARRMREDAVKRWEEKRKEVEAKVPEDKKKIATTSTTSSTPSLERAMGLEPEPDTFVCSDCGADVPADAKSCPVCGEKFE